MGGRAKKGDKWSLGACSRECTGDCMIPSREQKFLVPSLVFFFVRLAGWGWRVYVLNLRGAMMGG